MANGNEGPNHGSDIRELTRRLVVLEEQQLANTNALTLLATKHNDLARAIDKLVTAISQRFCGG